MERYDAKLHEERDKSEFRDKGCRKSTIKTAYGEVSYDRHVYQVRDEKGLGRYSLDEKVVTAGLHKASDFQKIRENMGSCFLWRGIKESLRGLRLCAKKTVARLP